MRPRSAPLSLLAAACAEATLTGVCYDSRETHPGDLFAALRGGDFDGHAFAAQAVAQGAIALLVEERLDLPVPQVVVPDSRAALAPVAAAFYGYPGQELGVVGITGTDGKTTTSYLVDAMLRHAGCRTGLVGTVSVRIGERVTNHSTRQTTPESADVQRYLREMVEAGATWAILEATSHGLPQHRLDAVPFRIGAVTNITHEHLDFHKTIAAYRRAKAILFERVAEQAGVAVVNLDDEGAREMLDYVAGTRVIRYSAAGDPAADLRAADVRPRADGTAFSLATREQTVPVSLPLIGGFNVANALCAAGIGLAAGLTLDVVAEALARAPTVPGRMARIDCGQPFNVVVDYAHTPESLTKVLQLLRGLTPNGRLIAVFGSAGERDVAKRARQGAVAARLADFGVFTTEDPRCEDADAIIAEIARGALEAGAREGEHFACITDRMDAIRLALRNARPGDCVLLAGKGHEGSIIWGREKRPWDEATAARTALAELGYGTD